MARLSEKLGYEVTRAAARRHLRAIRASDSDLMIVAEDPASAVVGWLQAHAAHIMESGFRVEITGLIVSAEARRRGIGRSLVMAAERWARRISARAVVVRSNVQRLESHAFYPALGYNQTKTQTVYRKALTGGTHHARRIESLE